MSYYDGIIPESCRGCFEQRDGKWVQTDPGLCDECDCLLELFPLPEPGKLLLDLMPDEAPDWTTPQ